jgi:RNA polymerase sigma-70 factor (ECF subfamily)
MQESDEHRWSALMVNAQAGNESDYRQLLQELANVIQRFLRSRFGDHHFIEDCVQEALIAVHQARHTYDSQRPFRPWLFAIVRHKAIDTLRKQRTREKVVDHHKSEQEILFQADDQSSSEVEFLEGRLLASLSAQHREVLVLTKIIGYSIAETAEKLGISESAVKVRVHRAIRRLQQSLARDEL